MENHINTLATKEDLAKLDVKISESKSETIKWMFIFLFGQLVAIFTFIFIFVKR